MKNKIQSLSNSLQKVLGSADEDFFDVTAADEETSTDTSSDEEVEEITEDEVNDAMDEETTEDDFGDEETEDEETSDEQSEDVETEISIDEGEEVEEDEEDDSMEETLDEETEDEETEDEEDADEQSDESEEEDGDFAEEPSEDDIVEVDDVEEVEDDDDDYSAEDDVVEVDDVEEVEDDDIDAASEEVGEELEEVEDDEVEEITDEDIENSECEGDECEDDDEVEEITDEDLIESGEVEEITDEDIENSKEEAESAADIVVDETATGSASELLASRGYQFETDASGRLCITGCDEAENKVEVVEDLPDDVQVAPADVNLVLHESASEDPFYSVLIKGKPVASIHLKDQEQSEDEDKRGFFISSEYPKALTDAMVKGGVNSVLDSVNAKRFTASVKSSALAEEMKKEAKAEMDSEIKAAVVQMKDKFIESVKLALAGMNKNFFTNDNDLKSSVYDAFASFGADNETAIKETEKVFANAEPFFVSVVSKAEELMGFDENSFKTIASAVSESGVGHRDIETFESKLMQGNNPVVAGFAKAEAKQVTASASNGKRLVFKKHIG